jgi:23S rRNA (adenine2030-N6)-methyltransferase
MNYRHAYHAGNFSDVVKHAALALLIEQLKHKDKPFFVLDTHAGTGRYDLASAEALKTNEAESGINRLWAAPQVPPELDAYMSAVAALNGGRKGKLRWYPGSPRLIRSLLRPRDRLVAVELHPDDAAKLAAEFRRDRQTRIERMDGYTALRSFLPPEERRGLAVVDPPFEVTNEFDLLAKGLRQGHRRWATGIYALWYPVKDMKLVAAFRESVAASGIRRILSAELWVEQPGDPEILTGCGLLVINPPFTFKESLESALPFLAKVLGRAPGAGSRVEWLVPE